MGDSPPSARCLSRWVHPIDTPLKSFQHDVHSAAAVHKITPCCTYTHIQAYSLDTPPHTDRLGTRGRLRIKKRMLQYWVCSGLSNSSSRRTLMWLTTTPHHQGEAVSCDSPTDKRAKGAAATVTIISRMHHIAKFTTCDAHPRWARYTGAHGQQARRADKVSSMASQ